MKALLFLSICLSGISVPAGNLYLEDTLIAKKQKNHSFFTYYELLTGLTINQGSIGTHYFKVNQTPHYAINFNLYSFKNLDVNISANYIKKSMVGTMDNTSRKYLFLYTIVSTQHLPWPKYNFDITYYSFDLKPKLTFFKKKKFQLSVGAGMRGNFLAGSHYNDGARSYEIDGFVSPNLKRFYINYAYTLGIAYQIKKIGFALLAEAEMNNDRKYITNWKYGLSPYFPRSFQGLYGAKFQCLLFRIGLRQYIR